MRYLKIFIAGLLWSILPHALLAPTASAQPESLVLRSPEGAAWRSALLPGWGQAYNRQYHKVPLVYVGLGALAASALYNNHQYRLYRHAALYKQEVDSGAGQENPYARYRDEYEHLLTKYEVMDLAPEDIRRVRGRYRDRRDLSYIGLVLFDMLVALDAYVSAHLLDFDVGEDLSLSVRPTMGGMGVLVRVER